MYIPKTDFGWSRRTGWKHGNEAGYNNLVKLWENKPKGRQRTRPIHESWNKVIELFDSSNQQQSQGAFCRWAGLKRATFSNWQVKPLTDDVNELVHEWYYTGDGEGLDGSMNTNQDRKNG